MSKLYMAERYSEVYLLLWEKCLLELVNILLCISALQGADFRLRGNYMDCHIIFGMVKNRTCLRYLYLFL